MTEPAAAQATPPAPVATPAPAAPVQPAPQPVAVPQPPAAQQGDADTIAKLQTELAAWKEQARKHEDRWKTRDDQLSKQEAALRLLAEKAGVDLDGEPDPAKLAEQVAQYQTSARQAATELAVFRAAQTAGADANVLLDSRSFMAKTSGLDSSAPDFAERVKALVAEHVAANPGATPAQNGQQPAADAGQQQPQVQPVTPLPAASGPVVTAAPVTGQQWTEADLAAATPEQTSRAIEQGLLENLGIGRPRRVRNR